MISLDVNGQRHMVDVPADMPLLWVIRDVLALTGTKFGCGVAQCGACTVHVDGEATRSCVLPVSTASGKQVRTIESLSKDNAHPVQQAWIAEQVPQCGFCQNGQIMTAKAMLDKVPNPTDTQIRETMNATLCRCMTYYRVQTAIKRAAKTIAETKPAPRKGVAA